MTICFSIASESRLLQRQEDIEHDTISNLNSSVLLYKLSVIFSYYGYSFISSFYLTKAWYIHCTNQTKTQYAMFHSGRVVGGNINQRLCQGLGAL